MGKTRDLFRKIRDIKGKFLARMVMIKNRNCRDLTEAEKIKKRWPEYTQDLYKESLNDPDSHNGVVPQSGSRHPGVLSQVGLRKHYYEQG